MRFRYILTATIALLGLTACMPHYSEGSWTGVVTKLSNKGIIWKSWEGEINLGGMRAKHSEQGTSYVGNIMAFNVSDYKVVEQVQAAQVSGKQVQLTYQQWLIEPLWISNDHVITGVKYLE